MKKQFKNPGTPFTLYVFILFIAALSLSSCSVKKMTFGTSAITPAATGQVKVKNDKNNNYNIRVSLRNLAPSSRLNPPRKNYIVWVETASNGTKNIGQFNASGKGLKASLSTNFPFKPEKVFITAEDAQDVTYPSGRIILTTN